jgi:hypothetical protein
LPSGVIIIGPDAFMGCTYITLSSLPSTVTTIGNEAFIGCTSLALVNLNATTPPTLGGNAFADTHASLAIRVPSANVSAYHGATNWSTYASRINAQ